MSRRQSRARRRPRLRPGKTREEGGGGMRLKAWGPASRRSDRPPSLNPHSPSSRFPLPSEWSSSPHVHLRKAVRQREHRSVERLLLDLGDLVLRLGAARLRDLERKDVAPELLPSCHRGPVAAELTVHHGEGSHALRGADVPRSIIASDEHVLALLPGDRLGLSGPLYLRRLAPL